MTKQQILKECCGIYGYKNKKKQEKSTTSDKQHNHL